MTYLPHIQGFLYIIFAGDTNIYLEAYKTGELEKVVNKELGSVIQWLDSNKVTVNIEKNDFIIFRSKEYRLTDNTNIKIGEQNIKQSQYVKFLGILLDKTLAGLTKLCELAKNLSRIRVFQDQILLSNG